uniref:Uncharacterized protein n=1 Tax=uncultured bacterium contig00053 TaxID=1181537 RepID=A0A806KG76_9BACT|nr:hypothetical protein [uncultured bacterium contig00053]
MPNKKWKARNDTSSGMPPESMNRKGMIAVQSTAQHLRTGIIHYLGRKNRTSQPKP